MKGWKNFVYSIVVHAVLIYSIYWNIAYRDVVQNCMAGQYSIEHRTELRQAIERYIQDNRSMSPGMAAGYTAMYVSAGKEFNVDPMLLAVVGKFESGFDPSIVSYTGAIGLQQIMPFWVKAIPFLNTQEDLYNPELNIKASAYILSHYRELCGDTIASMAACYHGGPRAILHPKVSTQKFKKAVSYAFYAMKASTTYDSSI